MGVNRCPARKSKYGFCQGDRAPPIAESILKILKGTNPAALPIEQPTAFELVINLKSMRTSPVNTPLAPWRKAAPSKSAISSRIVSRVWAGRLSFMSTPEISVTILLVGRTLLGVGESFIITGAQSWGLALNVDCG